ncbi:unnamed protein product [Sphacelaria rigidula]
MKQKAGSRQVESEWFVAAAGDLYNARVQVYPHFTSMYGCVFPWTRILAPASSSGSYAARCNQYLGGAVAYPRRPVLCSFHRSTGSGPAGRAVFTCAGYVSSTNHFWYRANDGSAPAVAAAMLPVAISTLAVQQYTRVVLIGARDLAENASSWAQPGTFCVTPLRPLIPNDTGDSQLWGP